VFVLANSKHLAVPALDIVHKTLHFWLARLGADTPAKLKDGSQ